MAELERSLIAERVKAGLRNALGKGQTARTAHSLCSIMASQHADVYAIQRRASHKNVSNTMIYTHISDRQANESAQEALMTAIPEVIF